MSKKSKKYAKKAQKNELLQRLNDLEVDVRHLSEEIDSREYSEYGYLKPMSYDQWVKQQYQAYLKSFDKGGD